jgi:chitin disaccharide deacetylase
MNFQKFFIILTLLLGLIILQSNTFSQNPDNEKIYLLIRCDDMGMNHSVNMAAQQLFASGIPVSVSVMFTCPWYQEAMEILKEYSDVSVGVHTTLNAEWKNYRWGPILGKTAVPTLVDSLGYFFPSRSKLFANNPLTNEIEMELRAQIERALNSGIKIDYIDHHMSAAVQTLELREMFEGLAKEYNLGISTYFGEKYSSVTYGAEIQNKTDSLITHLDSLMPGFNLQVLHIGLDTPEMRALKDLNTFGLANMSEHRQAELNSLLSPEFKTAIQKNNIQLITYRDIIRLTGIENMTRPEID